MPEEKPRPDEAFAQAAMEGGFIDEFCESEYADNSDECRAMIADRLQGGSESSPEPDPAGNPDPTDDPVQDVIMGDEDFEAMVADCANAGGILGIGANTEACMRVVAEHERSKR